MRELLFFAILACIAGIIFFVSLLELIFTTRRRKVNEELQAKLKELRATYNTSVNKMVLEDEAKIEEAEKQAELAAQKVEEEKKALEADYQAQIADITADSRKALDTAKAKAKKLEQEAHQKAEAYLAERQKEVEEELMNLVISVTKKVLPEGISYDAHKELVMQALRDVRIENGAKE